MKHPEWYDHNWKGGHVSTPWWDRSDIIDLDYSHTALRRNLHLTSFGASYGWAWAGRETRGRSLRELESGT